MEILKQIGHQGDTQWYGINSIPQSAKLLKKQFIAASEISGNVHALSGNYDMYEYEDGFVIDVKEDSILNHTDKNLLDENNWNTPVKLSPRDHNPSTIEKGIYFVGIQRKFNPLSKFMEKVKD
jgi:hypothetical protein